LDARRVGDHALLEIMNDPDGELRLLTIPGALTAKLRAH
jgi:hypothetical protein